jgi:hypothetical protein
MRVGGTLRKYQVINLLSAVLDLRTLLEISTPTTGQTFAEALESGQYLRADRLTYRCPADHTDGLPIRFRSDAPTSMGVVQRLIAASGHAPLYDVVFVDPHHTWWCSTTDLVGGWLLLRPGGVMVVHDCNPRCAEITSPVFRAGEWCGVTYQAYLDFVIGGGAGGYFTVDTDYGVGVVFKGVTGPAADPTLAAGWRKVGEEGDDPFEFFARHREELLHLVSEDWLVERYAGGMLGMGTCA